MVRGRRCRMSLTFPPVRRALRMVRRRSGWPTWGLGVMRRDFRSGSDQRRVASTRRASLDSARLICSKSFWRSSSKLDVVSLASTSTREGISTSPCALSLPRRSFARRVPAACDVGGAGTAICGNRRASDFSRSCGSFQNETKSWSKSSRCPARVTRLANRAARKALRSSTPAKPTARTAVSMDDGVTVIPPFRSRRAK